jgi:hypothetical protein
MRSVATCLVLPAVLAFLSACETPRLAPTAAARKTSDRAVRISADDPHAK